MQEQDARILIRRKKPAFSKEQRVGFGLVVGIGVLSLLMGVFYVSGSMMKAFELKYEGPPVLTSAQRQEQALLELQSTDSDEDGLTDYEELYVYRTSPYLADTDADGASDSLEIEVGTDPTCAGEECFGDEDAFEVVPTVIDVGEAPEFPEEDLEALNGSGTSSQPVTPDLVDVTAGEVRQLLLESGIDAATVNSYSDEQLLQIYRDSVREVSESDTDL